MPGLPNFSIFFWTFQDYKVSISHSPCPLAGEGTWNLKIPPTCTPVRKKQTVTETVCTTVCICQTLRLVWDIFFFDTLVEIHFTDNFYQNKIQNIEFVWQPKSLRSAFSILMINELKNKNCIKFRFVHQWYPRAYGLSYGTCPEIAQKDIEGANLRILS